MKSIVCYGDSNTWGYIPKVDRPENTCLNRYPRGVRWTSLLQERLGADYYVIENGLNGRTTAFDDPFCPFRNGLTELGAYIESQKPIDLIIIMLGTNDTKHFIGMRPIDIARGAQYLIQTVKAAACGPADGVPEILLMSPIRMLPEAVKGWIRDEFDESSVEKDGQLGEAMERIARDEGVHFFNLGKYVSANEADGIHMDVEGHKKAAELIEAQVRAILG